MTIVIMINKMMIEMMMKMTEGGRNQKNLKKHRCLIQKLRKGNYKRFRSSSYKIKGNPWKKWNKWKNKILKNKQLKIAKS